MIDGETLLSVVVGVVRFSIEKLRQALIVKLVILNISFLTSFILPLRVALIGKLVKSGIYLQHFLS